MATSTKATTIRSTRPSISVSQPLCVALGRSSGPLAFLTKRPLAGRAPVIIFEVTKYYRAKRIPYARRLSGPGLNRRRIAIVALGRTSIGRVTVGFRSIQTGMALPATHASDPGETLEAAQLRSALRNALLVL